MHKGLAAPGSRAPPAGNGSGGAERQVGAGRGRDRCSEGCLNVAGAWQVAAAGLFVIEVDDGGGFRTATAAPE